MKNQKTKPFKDGDRVVPDEALKAYIQRGGYDISYATEEAPLNDLVVKDKRIVGEGISLGFETDGTVEDGGGKIAGRILHAPTFGHLKAGDPCPFVVGMEVTTRYGVGTVTMVGEGPCIEVLMGGTTRVRSSYGFTSTGQKYGDLDINTIFPTPQQQPAHEYKFGDKVKCGVLTTPRYVFAHSNGLVAVMTEEQMGYVKDGQAVTMCTAIDDVVSPWPEPVTVQIGLDPEYGPATVHPEGIKVGCQVIRFEAFDKLAAEVAKIRGNDQ